MPIIIFKYYDFLLLYYTVSSPLRLWEDSMQLNSCHEFIVLSASPSNRSPECVHCLQ